MKKFISVFLLVFYLGIISFAAYDAFTLEDKNNLIIAMIFLAITGVLWMVLIAANIFTPPMTVGYLLPISFATLIYTAATDLFNICNFNNLAEGKLILINLILLFIYCVVTLPMYAMGKKGGT